MKKSQVLAAIALAFALGVVAPIASVSAMTHDDTKTAAVNEGSATSGEVATAVSAVSALYPTYDGMDALYALLNDTKITGADLQPGSYSIHGGSVTLPAVANTILNELFAAPFSMSAATLDAAVDDATISGVVKYTDVIDNVVELAEGVDDYDVMAKLFHALADKDDVKLREAIAQINDDFNVATPISYNTNVTTANYTTRPAGGSSIQDLVEVAVNAKGTVSYAQFQTLVGNVDKATAAADAYTAAVQKLGDAYKATGVMTNTGLAALANILNSTNPMISGAGSLADLVNTSSYTNNYNAWAGNTTSSVRVAVENAKTKASSYAGLYNYNLIMAIAEALRIAVPTPGKTAEQVADILVGYVAPTDPTGPNDTDKPGDAEKPGDDTTPGNTGAIATANGTASSTVAVVAGIATALTAAGAGVVAYRNARREA